VAWDFSTEPEFEAEGWRGWRRVFVRDEIHSVGRHWTLDWESYARVTAPLKEQVKERGLWARAPAARSWGGGGFGQVKLGLNARDLGAVPVRARAVFGNQAPDSGQRRATGHTAAHRSSRSAGCTRCCGAELAQRVLDDRSRAPAPTRPCLNHPAPYWTARETARTT